MTRLSSLVTIQCKKPPKTTIFNSGGTHELFIQRIDDHHRAQGPADSCNF